MKELWNTFEITLKELREVYKIIERTWREPWKASWDSLYQKCESVSQSETNQVLERPALLITLVRGHCHFFWIWGQALMGLDLPILSTPAFLIPLYSTCPPRQNEDSLNKILFFLKCEVQNAPKLNIWQSQINPSVDISRTAMTKLFCLKFSSSQING